MDNSWIFIYLLIGMISLCFYAIVLLLCLLTFILWKKNPKDIYEYLKNIVYGLFGGIIAVVILETKGESIVNSNFYLIKIPIILAASFTFILLGLLYLSILEKIFNYITKINLRRAGDESRRNLRIS